MTTQCQSRLYLPVRDYELSYVGFLHYDMFSTKAKEGRRFQQIHCFKFDWEVKTRIKE
jgi:hypothetical protein